MNPLLTTLYPAGAHGLTLEELTTTHNHPQLAEHLAYLVRARKIYQVEQEEQTRYVHPAFPPTRWHSDGTFSISAPSALMLAATVERLDREYQHLTARGYGNYGLTFTPGPKHRHPNPQPRNTSQLERIIDKLGISNITLEQLAEQPTNPNPTPREEIHANLELLQRTGLVQATPVRGELVYHFTWIDARLTKDHPLALQAREPEPALAATGLHFLLSGKDLDNSLSHHPDDLIEFTLEELAEATKPSNTTPNHQYIPLAKLFLTSLSQQGHLRYAGVNKQGQHTYRVHPELVAALRAPLFTPARIPNGYGPQTHEAIQATLNTSNQPLPNLIGYTVVDALTSTTLNNTPLKSISGLLTAHADHNHTLQTLAETLTQVEHGQLNDLPRQPPIKPLRPRQPRGGTRARLTPEQRNYLFTILRHYLNTPEPKRTPKAKLARQLNIGIDTIDRYIYKIQHHQA